MSCDAVAIAASLWMASFNPAAQTPAEQALRLSPPTLTRIVDAPVPAVAPPSMANQPLFKDIVKQAKSLKNEVNGYIKTGEKKAPTDPAWAIVNFEAFKTRVVTLSTIDQQGSQYLVDHNLDHDLKCIMHGISQDLTKRLEEVAAAKDVRSQLAALKEMSYLLNDNVEVITSPPIPTV
jgi:hypothetical protein